MMLFQNIALMTVFYSPNKMVRRVTSQWDDAVHTDDHRIRAISFGTELSLETA